MRLEEENHSMESSKDMQIHNLREQHLRSMDEIKMKTSIDMKQLNDKKKQVVELKEKIIERLKEFIEQQGNDVTYFKQKSSILSKKVAQLISTNISLDLSVEELSAERLSLKEKIAELEKVNKDGNDDNDDDNNDSDDEMIDEINGDVSVTKFLGTDMTMLLCPSEDVKNDAEEEVDHSVDDKRKYTDQIPGANNSHGCRNSNHRNLHNIHIDCNNRKVEHINVDNCVDSRKDIPEEKESIVSTDVILTENSMKRKSVSFNDTVETIFVESSKVERYSSKSKKRRGNRPKERGYCDSSVLSSHLKGIIGDSSCSSLYSYNRLEEPDQASIECDFDFDLDMDL